MPQTNPSSKKMGNQPTTDDRVDQTERDVELLQVLVTRKGTRVDAQWAIHPQLKRDLLASEQAEVTDLMAKVTDIIGHRFSKVLSDAEPPSPGHA